MSNHPPFNWRASSPLSSDQPFCEWRGMVLWAESSGHWSVEVFHEGEIEPEVITSGDIQAPGDGLEDAKRRAQGAAMALYQKYGNG